MQRSFGFWTAISMVVGSMIGGSIFVLPSSLAKFGWTSAVGWLVAGIGVLAIARVITDLTVRNPEEPGILTICGDVLGLLPGRIIAWSYWLLLVGAAAVLAMVAADYLSFLLPRLAEIEWMRPAMAFLILLAIAALNLRGVKGAGVFQVVTTVLKILPLVFVIGIAAYLVVAVPSTFTQTRSAPFDAALLTPTVGVLCFALLGFESASLIAQRVRDPERNVVRATLFGLALVLIIYFLASTAIVLATPVEELSGAPAPLAMFTTTHAGSWAGSAVAVFAAISAIGCLNACVLLLGDVPFGMVRDGQLPEWVAPGSERGVGQRPLLTGAGLAAILVLVSSNSVGEQVLDFLLRLTTASSIFFYAGICLASLKVGVQRPLAAFGVGFCAWVLYGTGPEASLLGISLMLVGTLLHFVIGGRTSPRGSVPSL